MSLELSDPIKNFVKLETKIKENKEPLNENRKKEFEKEIINSYNAIVNKAKPIWDSNNTTLIESARDKLHNEFYRLIRILKLINSNIDYPTTLDSEIKFKETPNEELLQSTQIYNKDTFRELLNDFDEWDKKITRKNASEKPEIVESRTNEIINAYNKLVEFAEPIIKNNGNKSTKEIRDELTARREYILDDLKILNSNAEVPDSITEKIKTQNNDEQENEQSNKSTGNKNEESNKKSSTIEPMPNANDKKNEESNNESSSTDPKTTSNDKKKEESNKNGQMNGKEENNDSKPEVSNKPKNKSNANMAMTSTEYYKLCTQQLNYTYTGDPLGLPPLIDAIELLQYLDTEHLHENILLRVLKTKLMGQAREYLPDDATVDEIKEILRKKIKVKSSKIIMGQLMALKADKTNFTDYAKRAEDLAEQFNRSLILEKIPTDTANNMTIDKTIDLCASNTRSQLVKSVLESTKFDDPKEVIATFIIQERKQKANENQVLAYQQTNRFTRNRNFNNARRFQRNNFHNNGYRNGFRAERQPFNNSYSQRGQNNGRGRPNGRGYNRNFRGNHRSIRYAENSESLPSGEHQTQQVELQRAEQ